jgi:hypothetical protein
MVDQETADKLNAYAEELEAQVAKLVEEPRHRGTPLVR